jgi:hypothetical protein
MDELLHIQAFEFLDFGQRDHEIALHDLLPAGEQDGHTEGIEEKETSMLLV